MGDTYSDASPSDSGETESETTEILRTRNGHGDEVWQVGSEFMTRDEAIYLAEKLRVGKTPPIWVRLMGDSATVSSEEYGE